MSISEEQVRNALKSVKYPGFSRDIVSFGVVKSIEIDNGEVKVQLALATNDPNVPATIKKDAESALRSSPSVTKLGAGWCGIWISIVYPRSNPCELCYTLLKIPFELHVARAR